MAPHNFAHSSTPRAMVAPIAATPSTPAERNVPTQHNEYSFEMLDENSENRQLYSPVKPKRSGSGLDESWASFVTEDTNNRDPPSTVFILTPNNHGGEKSPHARVLRDPPSFRQ